MNIHVAKKLLHYKLTTVLRKAGDRITLVIDEVVFFLGLDRLKYWVGNDVDVILVLAYVTAAREIEPKRRQNCSSRL